MHAQGTCRGADVPRVFGEGAPDVVVAWGRGRRFGLRGARCLRQMRSGVAGEVLGFHHEDLRMDGAMSRAPHFAEKFADVAGPRAESTRLHEPDRCGEARIDLAKLALDKTRNLVESGREAPGRESRACPRGNRGPRESGPRSPRRASSCDSPHRRTA